MAEHARCKLIRPSNGDGVGAMMRKHQLVVNMEFVPKRGSVGLTLLTRTLPATNATEAAARR
jgi:hypothetical protein